MTVFIIIFYVAPKLPVQGTENSCSARQRRQKKYYPQQPVRLKETKKHAIYSKTQAQVSTKEMWNIEIGNVTKAGVRSWGNLRSPFQRLGIPRKHALKFVYDWLLYE